MRYLLITFIIGFTYVFSASLADIGIKVKLANGKEVVVQREENPACLNFGMEPKLFWGGDYASSEVPKECKHQFITSKGTIAPMEFKGIKTVGELEVLEFLKDKVTKEPSKYALIDSRKEPWFELFTIPGALNVPYDMLVPDIDFMDEFNQNMKNLGVKILGENKYDFTNAKEAIFFCNGAWCVQSMKAMNILLLMGYPKDKMMWYRGGIHSWLSLSLTVAKPN